MGGGPVYSVSGSRIGQDGASSISWQASCEVDVSGWVKTNKIIIAGVLTTGEHAPSAGSFQLRWRNVTDAGSFAILVSGSGELRAGTSAGCITNTDPVGAFSGCAGATPTDDEEVENESPLQTASLQCVRDEFIETQWCVDFSNALDGKEYEFELYNATATESCGTLAASITTFIEAGDEDGVISVINENLNGIINNGIN